jgi:hypothetical protein
MALDSIYSLMNFCFTGIIFLSNLNKVNTSGEISHINLVLS